ncbi:mechanosensitive ion channel family protein [Paraglaciecola sp. 2405UD69-4]|uniref:mechanosensitive ion channel family protein n=1 Tax=Paraglaciecola sp. 2405UD69-4 TaxID=3391836 RepID=UPI0039C9F9FC
MLIEIAFTLLANIKIRPFDYVVAQQEGGGVESITEAQSLLVELWQNFMYRLPGIGIGLVVMVIFVLVASPLSKVLLKPASSSFTPLISSVLQRSISLFFILLGCYLFLYLAGLTGFAVAIVSGTGVVGLILGFAFRDIAENFISSLLLTVQRPFKIGDIVQVNGSTGIIQKVTARATTLVDFDGNHIQIPNATIYKGVIKNLTANPLMRGHFMLGVGYDADIKKAEQIALSVIEKHGNILRDPEPQILIDNLGPSTYNLKVYFWVNVEETSVLKMSSVLMRQLVEEYNQCGISMPDDARERVFPQGLNIVSTANVIAGSKDSLSSTSTKQSESQVIIKSEKRNLAVHDDVSSEANEIREQALRARDPENGENIM